MYSGVWVTDRKQRLTRNFDSPSPAADFSPQPEPAPIHISNPKKRRLEANLLPFDFVLDFWTCYLSSMRTEANRWDSHSLADRLANASPERWAGFAARLFLLHDATPSLLWLGMG
jgi:hypothetical protein